MTEENSTNPNCLELPTTLGAEAIEQVVNDLLVRRGEDLVINAGPVERIDTPGFEMLIAATQLWQKDDQSLSYTEKSARFEEAMVILGIDATMLEHGVR